MTYIINTHECNGIPRTEYRYAPEPEDLADDLPQDQAPLRCGQCDHFEVRGQDYSQGVCRLRKVMGYGDGDITTLEERRSSDLACHRLKVTCPF